MTDDLLAALLASVAEAPEPDAQWLTCREIQSRLNITQHQALERLHRLQAAGQLEVAWVVRPNLAGARQRRPAYRLRRETPGG